MRLRTHSRERLHARLRYRFLIQIIKKFHIELI